MNGNSHMNNDLQSLFLRKADENGIRVLGITPAVVPDRGNGMVASRNIDVSFGFYHNVFFPAP